MLSLTSNSASQFASSRGLRGITYPARLIRRARWSTSLEAFVNPATNVSDAVGQIKRGGVDFLSRVVEV